MPLNPDFEKLGSALVCEILRYILMGFKRVEFNAFHRGKYSLFKRTKIRKNFCEFSVFRISGLKI